jgi:sterol desaturase/sphingolipid hydroxylase (fatty acid hydroxylase superfamily)
LVETIAHDALRTLAGLLTGLAVFRTLELAFPQRDAKPPERNGLGLRIWLTYVAAQIALTSVVLGVMDSSGSPQLDPGSLAGLPSWAAALLLGLAIILAKDFLFYVEHRLQHRWLWLWRWHEPHHAIRNLSATNSWHHWSEILMFALFVSLPMSLLSPAFGPRPFILGLLLNWMPIYLHSSTRLQMGRLRWLIVDSRYHRIHHSLDPRHFDKNFGAATPLWDWLFGTLYMPAKDEWPDVGLAGVDEPATISEWSLLPWRKRKPQEPLQESEVDEPLGRAA